jgi:hypothetical protein
MKKRIQIIFLWPILLGGIYPISQAQSDCTVHLDKGFYVTGEKIRYKLYMPFMPLTGKASILASFIQAEGKIVESYHISAIRQYAHGEFNIPLDLASGWCTLLFTSFDPEIKKSRTLLTMEVPLYNDLDPIPSGHDTVYITSNVNQSEELKIDLNVPIELTRTRDTWEGTISVKDKSGMPLSGATVSVSIRDQTLNESERIKPLSIQSNTLSTKWNASELLAFDIQQRIPHTGSEKALISVFFPQEWNFRYISSSSGLYSFTSEPFIGQKPVQIIHLTDFTIPISRKQFPAPTSTKPLPYPAFIKRYIALSYQRKKLNALFKIRDSTMIPSQGIFKSKTIPTPDRIVDVEKYDDFEDLSVLFRELNTPLQFKADRAKRIQASIYNPEMNTMLDGHPVFILDGKLTDRADWVAKLPTRQIKKIDIYHSTKILLNYFGLIGKSGLVVIHPKDKLFVPDSIAGNFQSLPGIQTFPAEFKINPNEIRNDKSPIFKPLLYWHANLTTNQEGQLPITFFQSDDISRFTVEIVAMDSGGKITSKSFTYQTTRIKS